MASIGCVTCNGETYKNDLVDELRLIVLGTGKRLFGETTDSKRLQLSSATVVGDGVAIQVYMRR